MNLKNILMTSNYTFQIYYSKEFKLFDLVINKNKQFHKHFHHASIKTLNKTIKKYINKLT